MTLQAQDLTHITSFTLPASHSPSYPLLAPFPYAHRLTFSLLVPSPAPKPSSNTVDYTQLCTTLLAHAQRPNKFAGTEELAAALCNVALEHALLDEVVVTVEKLRYGDREEENKWPMRVGLEARRWRTGEHADTDTVRISGLPLDVMVGIHEWERMERGVALVDVELVCEAWRGGAGVDLPALVGALLESVSTSDDLTLESLASSIARTALAYGRGAQHPPREATVTLTKPHGVPRAEAVAVKVTRTAASFAKPSPSSQPKHTTKALSAGPAKHAAVVALGSNLGNRYANIENALRQMEARNGIVTVTGSSFLYESTPMYVEDQGMFLNCVVTVETTLKPQDLLTLLKHVENVVGRVKSVRNGPRSVDLDIIFYDSAVVDTRRDGGDGSREGELVIPHPRLGEREFVLRPLNDIIPDYIHPGLKTSVKALFTAHSASNASTLRKVLPFPAPPRYPKIPTRLWPLSSKTYLMATINTTPDSFSSSSPSTTASALVDALAAASAGADIIDVGGYSTRPGAAAVSLEDELRRVVPVVRKMREQGITLPISVDTFRPGVLRAAVEAGANCLNDVTALAGEDGMAAVVRELGVPVVMMHSRGAHRAGEDKEYGPDGVLEGVRRELGARVAHGLTCGLRRWQMVVDPGFGFSKSTEGNVEVLRRFSELTRAGAENPLEGYPTLAGLSRKSFLGKVLDRETQAQERDWATGAAVAAAVQQGASVVRVHDVAAMRDVIRIADAIWR